MTRGLTEAEWKANPQQAPRAEQYDTRKTIKQTQAGLRYERSLSAQDDMSVMMYAGSEKRPSTSQSRWHHNLTRRMRAA